MPNALARTSSALSRTVSTLGGREEGAGHSADRMLHVGGIGLQGWNRTPEGEGEYENGLKLGEVFNQFGPFEQAVVRHRYDEHTKMNTSWAVVTMGTKAAAMAALSAPEVLAGRFPLAVTKFDMHRISSLQEVDTVMAKALGRSNHDLKLKFSTMDIAQDARAAATETIGMLASAEATQAKIAEHLGKTTWANQLCLSVVTVLRSMTIIVLVSFVGSAIFTALESDEEDTSRLKYAARMGAIQLRYNLSTEDFLYLEEQVGVLVAWDPEDNVKRNWGVWNMNSLLFVFTVASTVGYGNFAPVTQGGKMFLVLYCLAAIPAVAFALTSLVRRIMQALEYFKVMRMPELSEAFNKYDVDGSGELDASEFLKALRVHSTSTDTDS
jgi:hypothetical protein